MSINSHYVPHFYLKNFLIPGENRLWVFDKKLKEFRCQSPNDTAVIKDYYLTATEKREGKDSVVEDLLATIEREAAPILKKWSAMPTKLERVDIEKMALFITLLHVRVPRSIEATREIAKVGLENAIERIKQGAHDEEYVKKSFEGYCEKTGNPENCTYDEYLQLCKDPSKNPRSGVIFDILPTNDFVKGLSFSAISEISNVLLKMNWYIVVSGEDDYFFTSDSPVNVFCRDKDGRAFFGGGFALPNVEVSFPISPRVCLKIDQRYEGCRGVGKLYVREMNRRASHMAERFIFSAYRTEETDKISGEFSYTQNLPKMDKEIIRENILNQNKDI